MGWTNTPIVKTHSAKLVWKFNFFQPARALIKQNKENENRMFDLVKRQNTPEKCGCKNRKKKDFIKKIIVRYYDLWSGIFLLFLGDAPQVILKIYKDFNTKFSNQKIQDNIKKKIFVSDNWYIKRNAKSFFAMLNKYKPLQTYSTKWCAWDARLCSGHLKFKSPLDVCDKLTSWYKKSTGQQ